MEKMDKNNDGAVTFDEFHAQMAEICNIYNAKLNSSDSADFYSYGYNIRKGYYR